MENKFIEIKTKVQELIDLIASGESEDANDKWADVSELLDELLDHSEDDQDLQEISRYQVLLNQLYQKMNGDEE